MRFATALFFLSTTFTFAAETIWIEAEHLRGVRGSCFPDMGHDTKGAWAISGPGIAPEWTQGGESEWLSIACGPNDATASATMEFEVPEAGDWRLWVRYRDWRGQSEVFGVKIEQAGTEPVQSRFGEKPVVDEDDELKLLWKWAFGWDVRPVTLPKGAAKLTLLSLEKQAAHRQIDAICLTTDPAYRPRHREKPRHLAWDFLDSLRAPTPATIGKFDLQPRPEWKPISFRNEGLRYLWNMGEPWLKDLASDKPDRVRVPFHIDPVWADEFRKMFGGRDDVPIFSDPRIVPLFHGAGPNILENASFVKWLEANPTRAWGNMMNYIGPKPLSPEGKALWAKFRDRYVGNISGENLGYFDSDGAALRTRVAGAKTRQDVLDALTEIYMAGNAAKQKAVFGEAPEKPYEFTIACLSAEMLGFAHACREWGARTVGYENQVPAPSLAMRMAFLRGSARQFGGMVANYRSCNFGDASSIYSQQSLYAAPKHVYDNYYDVWAGAGMTWYKFDLWHQYMAGSELIYHEQGFDEFWIPAGGSTPAKPLQLSPKGRVVEQFLAVTKAHPDRGAPWTPIAFLLDRAHGWDPTAYRPTYFGLDETMNPTVLPFDQHARMLKEWFKAAFHPFGPHEAEPTNSVNQNTIPGVFGDIFDVLVTSPSRLDAIDSYPVIVLCGELDLTAAWGKKLAAFLERGGTVVASDGQLRGPGAAELALPALGAEAEATAITWNGGKREIPSQRFRFRAIEGGEPLAIAGGAQVAAAFPRGKGRLIFASIPRGLGLDSTATPLVGALLSHVRRGLLPFEIRGEVEWLLNRTDRGWVVTLLNPSGARKPQHGVVVTDYAQTRAVTLRTTQPLKRANEWIANAAVAVKADDGGSTITLEVPAGALRILEVE